MPFGSVSCVSGAGAGVTAVVGSAGLVAASTDEGVGAAHSARSATDTKPKRRITWTTDLPPSERKPAPMRGRPAKLNCDAGESGAGQKPLDFSRLGKAPDLLLREDDLSIRDDFEDSAVSRRERGFNPEVLLQLGRQTGGLWSVASFQAIADLDVHGNYLTGW